MRIYLVIGREAYEDDVTIKAFCDERDAESLAEKLREIQSREPKDLDEYCDDGLWQADFNKWAHEMKDAGCPFITGWEEIVVEPLEVVGSQPAEQERTCRWEATWHTDVDEVIDYYATSCESEEMEIPSSGVCPGCGGKIVEGE